jgi:hypothetical protein
VHTGFLVGETRVKETTWKTDVDGKIILKWTLKKRDGVPGLE